MEQILVILVDGLHTANKIKTTNLKLVSLL